MRESLRLFTTGGLGLTLQPNDVYSQLVNRAHEDIVESYDWSFRLTNTVINTVPPKSNGSITLTTGSPSILGTGTTFTLADVGSFLWLGNSGNTPLPIADVQGAQLASLANPYSGPSTIQTSYIVAPLFYLVENALEVLSVVNQDWLLQKRQREEFNRADPCRTDQGGSPSEFWCQAPPSPDGSLMIELWPVPADARGYLVEFRCRAPKLIRDGDLPLVKSIVVEEKAIAMACQMVFSSTGARQWLELSDKHQQLYQLALEEALASDARRQQFRPGVTNPGPITDGTYDAVFTPDHSGADGDW